MDVVMAMTEEKSDWVFVTSQETQVVLRYLQLSLSQLRGRGSIRFD